MIKHWCMRQNNGHVPNLYTSVSLPESGDRAQLVEYLLNINEALGSISSIP